MNGQHKLIQDIERGDIVAADPQFKNGYRVAYVNKNTISNDTKINICDFSTNSIDYNIPSKNLLITEGHPIIIIKYAVRAYIFQDFPNVKIFKNVKAIDILPEVNDEYYLWDLQFDTNGSYRA